MSGACRPVLKIRSTHLRLERLSRLESSWARKTLVPQRDKIEPCVLPRKTSTRRWKVTRRARKSLRTASPLARACSRDAELRRRHLRTSSPISRSTLHRDVRDGWLLSLCGLTMQREELLLVTCMSTMTFLLLLCSSSAMLIVTCSPCFSVDMLQ